jgi:hypothetical protein
VLVVPLIVDSATHRAILDFMMRSMQLKIGIAGSALLLLSGAEARGEWSAEQLKWAASCQSEAVDQYAVAEYRFQVVDVTLEPGVRRVWLRFGPPGDPKRHGMGCTFDDRWGAKPGIALAEPAPPKRSAR